METKDKIIFIVEDSDIISGLLERVINNTHGYTGKTFATGEAMIEALENEIPDGLLLDYYLDPSKKGFMNGEQVLQKMQIQDIQVPVIMLTGLQDVIKLERLKYLNVVEILNKDNSDIFEKVIQAIQSAT